MNILVCWKQVPDTAAKIEVKDGRVDEAAIPGYVVNPYDEFALEEVLRLKETLGGGKITLLTLGPDRAREAIMSGLAMGADEAVHIKGDAFPARDADVVARILAAGAKKSGFDLIVTGKQGVDGDSAHVGPALAEFLGLPHVAVLTKFQVAADQSKATCQREVEGGQEVIEVSLPAVLTITKTPNEPRYPTLKGIMGAKKKPYQEWTIDQLGLAPADLEPKVQVVNVVPPPARAAGRVIPGDAAAAAKEVVRLLREEAKVV